MPSATACVGSHGNVAQADRRSPLLELRERQGAGDAAHVAAALGTFVGSQRVIGDDVGDADPAARAQDARDLGEDGRLVRGQVDDAVADDDVDRVGRQRDLLDVALEQLDVGHAGLGDVALGEGEHLVGHVEAEDAAGRADALGRQEHIDAAARAQVEHPLALVQLGHGDRVAAAERSHHGRVGQLVALEGAVQLGADALAWRAARFVASLEHRQRRLGVAALGRGRGSVRSSGRDSITAIYRRSPI